MTSKPPFLEGSVGTGHWVERLHPFLVKDGRIAMWKAVGVTPYAKKIELMKKLGIPEERYFKINPGDPMPVDFFKDLDVVHIASYNQFHPSQTVECLENGVMCVVEKTFSPMEEEFKKIIEFIKTKGFEKMATLDIHYTEKAPTLELFEGRALLKENIEKYGKIERVVGTFFEASTPEDKRRILWLSRPEEGGIETDWFPHPLSVLHKYCGARIGKCLGAQKLVIDPDFHSENGTGAFGKFELSGKNFLPSATATIRVGKGFPKGFDHKVLRFWHENSAYTDVRYYSTSTEMRLGMRGEFKTVIVENGKEIVVGRENAAGNVSYKNLVNAMVDMISGGNTVLSISEIEEIFSTLWKYKKMLGFAPPIKDAESVQEFARNGLSKIEAGI